MSKLKINTCIICNTQFEASHKAIKTCSEACSSINSQRLHEERRIKTVKARSKRLMETGIENVDYVIDQWNGYATKRMYGIWFKNMHPGRTLQEYKKEFPGALLVCESDKKETSKSSGLHMKKDKYRKMQSEKIKGKGNPNHASKTTLEQRQMKSPFSTKFVKYQDKENKEKAVSDFAKKALENRVTETNLEYWLNKVNSLEEAERMYKERQRTFSLETCIEKYGEEKGTRIWKERNRKWSTKIERMYKEGKFTKFCKSNWSNAEEIFIKHLVNNLDMDDDKYHSCINGKQFYRHFKELGQTFAYDFVFNKKIIEFNGDFWHCNPKIYDSEYINTVLQMSAKDKWKLDEIKINQIKNCGYQVLTVWESDYNQDPQGTMQKCINFLKED